MPTPAPYQKTLFERIFGGGHDINLPPEGELDPVLQSTPTPLQQIPKIQQGYSALSDLAAKGKAIMDADAAKKKAFEEAQKQALSPSMQGIVNAQGNQ